MKTASTFMTGLAIGLGLCALMMIIDKNEPGPKMIMGFAVIVLIAAQALSLTMKETSIQPSTQQ